MYPGERAKFGQQVILAIKSSSNQYPSLPMGGLATPLQHGAAHIHTHALHVCVCMYYVVLNASRNDHVLYRATALASHVCNL